MKFHQLQVGQRFQFKGAIYTKTNGLMATAEQDSGQQMIPRSANVLLLDEGKDNRQQRQTLVSISAVTHAQQQFYQHCQDCLQRLAPLLDTESLSMARMTLENARHQFNQALSNAAEKSV